MILIVHTDTTGRWLFGDPPTNPDQPHMIRVGAALVDERDPDAAPADLILRVIRPLPGWKIEPGAALFHGVTWDVAEQQGYALRAVVAQLQAMAKKANAVAGFPIGYQAHVLQRAALDADTEILLPGDRRCLMGLAGLAMRKPGRDTRNFRTPKMADAIEHFTGRPWAPPADPLERGMSTLLGLVAVWRGVQPRSEAA